MNKFVLMLLLIFQLFEAVMSHITHLADYMLNLSHTTELQPNLTSISHQK